MAYVKIVQGTFYQGNACTVHKVQGLSLDQAVLSFNLLKQRAFNHGQLYVALRVDLDVVLYSCFTRLESIAIKINKGVT